MENDVERVSRISSAFLHCLQDVFNKNQDLALRATIGTIMSFVAGLDAKSRKVFAINIVAYLVDIGREKFEDGDDFLNFLLELPKEDRLQ